jgi:S1-C subfamily serine protease
MKNIMKMRHLATLCMAAATAGMLASCGGHSDAEMQQVKSDADMARADAQNERRSKEEAELHGKLIEREVKHLKEQLDEVQKDREKLEDAVKKLDKEFTDYKEKYKAAILGKVPGLAIKPLVYEKRNYDNLVVRNIDGDLLIISHPNGLLHLKTSDLPPDTQAFLALDQKTEFHSKMAAFLKEFDNHKLAEIGVMPTQPKPTTAKKPVNSKPEPPAPRPNAFDQELMKFIAQVTGSGPDGGNSVGSGFIAKQGNSTYFYTNAHLVVGATSLSTVTTDGRRFNVPDLLEMSDEDEAFDVVRFKLGGGGIPALDLAESSAELKVGDKVIAVGESGNGGGYASGPIVEDKVLALGAFWVDAGSSTSKGDTGGPLMLDGTSKVVGIVSHYANPMGYRGDVASPYNPLGGVRRVCLRPDQIKKWRTSSLTRLAQEPGILDQIDLDNGVLQSVASATFGDQGVTGVSEDSLIAGGKSALGAMIANSMRNVNAFFSRNHPTSKGGRKTAAAIAPTTVREQCSVFVTAVLQVYGSGVANVDESSFSRFSRARFHLLADQRRSICVSVRSHLEGEITRIDPYQK